MKYHKGQKVKIKTDIDKPTSWSVISAMKSYPDAIFTIEDVDIRSKMIQSIEDLGVYYTIVTEPKIKTTTYRYDIKEDYLISLEEIRDDQINKILDNGKVS